MTRDLINGGTRAYAGGCNEGFDTRSRHVRDKMRQE